MTDEQMKLVWDDYEKRQEADKKMADVLPTTGRWVLGPDGHLMPSEQVFPTPTRQPFDWGAFWAQTSPYVFRIITIALAAAATYFGLDASKKAGEASNHAEAAVVQSKENTVKIDQAAGAATAAHQAAEHSAKQIDRMAGTVADRVPGK